ncbi:IS110 family transposase, partial [Thioalkalivibrio sp. ALE19]
GTFRSSDAFVAFLGMDVRVRDSGQKRGRRRLTKQGDPELRRLLYMAAMQAKSKPAWSDYYQRCLDRGLATTQALNALARKLARVAFALMKNQTDYRPPNPCTQT